MYLFVYLLFSQDFMECRTKGQTRAASAIENPVNDDDDDDDVHCRSPREHNAPKWQASSTSHSQIKKFKKFIINGIPPHQSSRPSPRPEIVKSAAHKSIKSRKTAAVYPTQCPHCLPIKHHTSTRLPCRESRHPLG